MIDVIRSESRGNADHGWLKSKHTFSFANYHNPSMMGFGKLRVVNEDRVEPGQGFGTHPHRDMEIVTYVIDGALEHKDSMGNGSIIRPGELQRMTAGTGVLHSEYNHSTEDVVHFLQIWILPERNGLEPGYAQKLFATEQKRNHWHLVASRDGRDGALTIHQDVNLYATVLDKDRELDHAFDGRRRGFLQVVKGSVAIGGEQLLAGDAVAMQDQAALRIRAAAAAELLLFDMA
ncbi:MAG: pirin family protein [Gammaproteobacteria bacterium]|nr:pirin family protein [Gammaproteobacteria bacterium]